MDITGFLNPRGMTVLLSLRLFFFIHMERRGFLGVGTTALFGGIAGCSSTSDSPENSSESQQEQNETVDENATQTNESEPESSEPDEDDTERQIDPPEIDSISLEPTKRGPDEKIPRGADITVTITGGSALQDGQNELIVDLQIEGQGRSEEQAEQITVSGEGDYTEFESEVVFSTEPFLPGTNTVTVRLTDEDINANIVSGGVEFELAEYYLSTIEILEELNNHQQQMVTEYTSFGSVSTIDQVPVVLNNFSASDVRDPARQADQKWAEFDVEAPDVLDAISSYEDAENTVQWEIISLHEAFVNFTAKVINDLGTLREIEFDSYAEVPDEYVQAVNRYTETLEGYPSRLNNLSSQHSTLEEALDGIDDREEPYRYTERADTFQTDITALENLIPALERVQSATEIILVAGTLDEDNDRGRRESRIDAMDRIRSARDIMRGLETPTSSEVVNNVIDFTNHLESAADDL